MRVNRRLVWSLGDIDGAPLAAHNRHRLLLLLLQFDTVARLAASGEPQ